jgi:hypothetical protein
MPLPVDKFIRINLGQRQRFHDEAYSMIRNPPKGEPTADRSSYSEAKAAIEDALSIPDEEI